MTLPDLESASWVMPHEGFASMLAGCETGSPHVSRVWGTQPTASSIIFQCSLEAPGKPNPALLGGSQCNANKVLTVLAYCCINFLFFSFFPNEAWLGTSRQGQAQQKLVACLRPGCGRICSRASDPARSGAGLGVLFWATGPGPGSAGRLWDRGRGNNHSAQNNWWMHANSHPRGHKRQEC